MMPRERTGPKVVTSDDHAFLGNVKDARENGYALCCSECGAGIYDENDLHDSTCSLSNEAESA